MNLNILAFVFKNEVHCKMCNSGLDMQVLKGKSGLAITFVLKCHACPYRVEFSSNVHEGTQIATVNTRYIIGTPVIKRTFFYWPLACIRHGIEVFNKVHQNSSCVSSSDRRRKSRSKKPTNTQ
ncbi:uncharacterized protein TNIN_326101 [Trichonephila inaurata madagascariensis]|uniref:Uncharacterized protein n=1 Tax=Trichonephila inaurata madagascariensis TaxID=2747483 RepID=A0A8X6M815_9ARAC|nr:uncharacterized protein TNIN_326101 [Trichonephila inaurata madagascariensis]